MRYFLFAFFFLASLNLKAQGIEFFSGSFDEAKALAQKTDKPIFMDAYASWCGPCKRMAAKVFTKQEVGDFFNKNFVNLKVDMEKGEGVSLRRTYGVSAYPTLLFLNADGSVINSVRGARGAAAFIALGKEAAMPGGEEMQALEKQYNEGNREPSFLYEYYEALKLINSDKTENVYQDLIEAIPDELVTKKPYAALFYENLGEVGSASFNKVVDNMAGFSELYGSQEVEQNLSRQIRDLVSRSGETGDKGGLKTALKASKKVNPDNFKEKKALYKTIFFGSKGDWKAYMKAVDKYLGKYAPNNAAAYNDVAWNFYTLVDEVSLLKDAEKYAQRAIEIQPEGAYFKTLSFLLMKQKRYAEAADFAEKAIAAYGADSKDAKDLKPLPKALRKRAESTQSE